jgi:tight adherence protein B
MDITTILIIIIGIAAAVLIAVGFFSGDDSSVEERLAKYTELANLPQEVDPEKKEDKSKTSPVADYLEKTLSRAEWFANVSRDLARADLRYRPSEYLSLMVVCSLGVGVISGLLFKSIYVAPVGAIIGVFLPGFYVRNKKTTRLHTFEAQLADMLNLAVNSLRAGYSVLQALESVSKEMPYPTNGEIRRVVQEVQIGISMETALDNLLRRMDSPDLKLVVTAMNIQREVGGNLAEILETISHTIRERVRIKGEIRVLTSQQMATGYLVAGMPFALSAFLYLDNPTYIMRFFDPATSTCGIPMVICAFLLIASGFFAVRQIVNIEV